MELSVTVIRLADSEVLNTSVTEDCAVLLSLPLTCMTKAGGSTNSKGPASSLYTGTSDVLKVVKSA